MAMHGESGRVALDDMRNLTHAREGVNELFLGDVFADLNLLEVTVADEALRLPLGLECLAARAVWGGVDEFHGLDFAPGWGSLAELGDDLDDHSKDRGGASQGDDQHARTVGQGCVEVAALALSALRAALAFVACVHFDPPVF